MHFNFKAYNYHLFFVLLISACATSSFYSKENEENQSLILKQVEIEENKVIVQELTTQPNVCHFQFSHLDFVLYRVNSCTK